MSTGRIRVAKQANSSSTLPEIGKIKIGLKAKSANGTEYPKAIDYFHATGSFANEFTRLFGEKPKSLQVAFISDDLNEVCNERFESWEKGKRYGWGDGEKFTVWDGSKYVEGVPATDTKVRSLKWERTLTLRFVLLKMKGILGVWTFQTKAKEVTIPSIVKSFDLVRDKAGTIIGFPFNLMVEMKKSYSPGESRIYPVVSLIPNFTEESMEAVRAYVESGGQLNRITTRMIESGAIEEEVKVLKLEEGGGK